MATRTITFDDGRGGRLAARLDLPVDDTPVAFAVLVDCLPDAGDARPDPARGDGAAALDSLVGALGRAGIAVLRIDAVRSREDVDGTDHGTSVDDVLAASAYLGREHRGPDLLIGHSLGAAAVLLAARRVDGVRAVAIVGAPPSPERVLPREGSDQHARRRAGPEDHAAADRVRAAAKAFFDRLAPNDIVDAAAELKVPMLVLHAPGDQTVASAGAREIFDAAAQPKSLMALDGADHFLTRGADARFAGEVLSLWARRHVTPPEPPSWKDDIRDNRAIVRTGRSLRTEGLANGFGIVLDEPTEVGGTGTGPTPYDYLAAALAACTSMTLRMYADRKGWPLEAATVSVRHAKVHAEDCEDCEKPQARVDRFERVLRLEGRLEDEQRRRLLEIANRCPVHRTLEADVRIESELLA